MPASSQAGAMTCCWSPVTRRDSRTLPANSRRTTAFGVTCSFADLAQSDAAHQLFVESRQYRQTPDILINNAGFGLYGEFVSHPLPRIQEMLHVHVRTVAESIRLFLPGMLERGSGTIINVASIAGLLPIPHFAEYAATKAFLVSFSEALAEETQGTGVVVQACCPGQTETDFHSTAGYRPPGLLAHANGRPGGPRVPGRIAEQGPRRHHRLARQADGFGDKMVATDVPHQNRGANHQAGNPVRSHVLNAFHSSRASRQRALSTRGSLTNRLTGTAIISSAG